MFLEIFYEGENMKFKRIFILLLTVILLFTTACAGNGGKSDVLQPSGSQESTSAITSPAEATKAETETQTDEPPDVTQTEPPATTAETPPPAPTVSLPVFGEYYYDVTNVVLYLELYGELPPNFITKTEARKLGWSGGSVGDYFEGGAIGGDFFGNYEELLPKAEGRTYHECDIDTDSSSGRGAKRIVFSSDGLYFYTSDHYESFSQVYVTEDYEVTW